MSEPTDALARRLAEMPKVELHVHLEGATDADTIWELAQRNQVSLPADSLEGWRRYYEFRDFDHFIDVYELACAAVRTPEDYAFLIERFIAGQARQNVRYTEAFLSATIHLNKFSPDDYIAAVADGLARGERRYGVRVRFIPDISRHFPEERWKVLEIASEGRQQGVFLGLGLGGREIGFPPELFADVYAEARQRGLRLHAHAGETGGAASVRGAVETLGAERIGHGFQCLDDLGLVRALADSRVPFELSPTSNYCLGVVPRDQQHPIRRMIEEGLFCTVNSDDPPMFNTELTAEYHLLARQGFSWEELWQLNLNAIEAAFLDEEEKADLRREFDTFSAKLA